MALPKQVQKQMEEVEAMEKLMQAPNEAPVAEEAAAEPEVKDTADADVAASDPPEPVVEGTSSEPVVKTVPDEFEHKYNTLRGKYDAEVPRLHSQVRDLTAKLTEMQEAVEKLSAPPPKEPVSLVTDADREAFGEDLLDVQRRVAEEVASKYETRLAAQDAMIEGMRKALADTGDHIGEVTFEAQLHRLVPDYDAINVDPKWIAWLNSVDPILRGPRRNAAQDAFNRGDAEAIADYIALFKQQTAVEAKPTNKADDELLKQVTPSRTTVTEEVADTATGKVYSASAADEVWKKIRTLHRQGKSDEADKLEAEITVAYMEHRVQT